MNLNGDFSKRAVVHAAELDWVPSPMPGVERRMLDRIGQEVARATTIVRYAPDSRFSPHVHTGGEEFLVLQGVFQDEHGDYPEGSYVRNPPQSSHTPGSREGCTILVKLWQFAPQDRTHVNIDTRRADYSEDPSRPGVRVLPLFHDSREQVQMEIWQPGGRLEEKNPDGLELLVIEGGFREQDEDFAPQSWLRLPPGRPFCASVGPHGARVWTKRNHLSELLRENGSGFLPNP